MERVIRDHRSRAGWTAGFTLLELLLAIAVMAILTSLAVPAFTQFIQNNRLAAQANELVAALQYGRSEALKRGASVQVCSSSGGTACDGKWSETWIAVVNPGGADEEVIRVWPSPGSDFKFTPETGDIQFDESGFRADNCTDDDCEWTFDLQLPGCTNDNLRRVRIERTGRIASERLKCPS